MDNVNCRRCFAPKNGSIFKCQIVLRWEFIKENKKVRKQENKNSTKKVIKN